MYAISGVWWHLPSNDCDLHEQKCEFAPDKKTSQSLIHPAKHARKHCFHDCTSGELTNISFLGDHCRRWVSQAYPGGSC